MSKSLGITLYSGEEEVKERYKHEKLFELYRSGDLSIGREYLSKHIGYFIQQAGRAVNDHLYEWTFVESFTLVDEQIQKQIEKMGEDLNPIKSGRYLVMRLRGHLLNSQIKDKFTYDREYAALTEEKEECELMEVDMVEHNLRCIGLTEMENEIFRMRQLGLQEEVIRRSIGISRGKYRNLLQKAITKIRAYYVSQGIGD